VVGKEKVDVSTNLKISAGLVAVFAMVVAVFAIASRPPSDDTAPAGQAAAAPIVRENSHRLSTAPDGRVTLVEFLDFECESCRAAFPFVEELRKKYDGKVTFVARYYPLPAHKNSETSALAVEAAAQQGKFEAMYAKMYETQATWGEQQESQALLFRSFAESLGLDLGAYDRAVADPATLQRIEQDKNDGTALGVQGTPTFFLNGTKIQPESTEEFQKLIDDALAG
jgi:protein-disulfide isomerase